MCNVLIRYTFAAAFLSYGLSASAINPNDDYYSDDIFKAIKEAKKSPHHYDYSNSKRYNRTTTQSIEIPRLLNTEMKDTSIQSQQSTEYDAELSENTVSDDKLRIQPNQINSRNTTVTPTGIQTGNPNVRSGPIQTNVTVR